MELAINYSILYLFFIASFSICRKQKRQAGVEMGAQGLRVWPTEYGWRRGQAPSSYCGPAQRGLGPGRICGQDQSRGRGMGDGEPRVIIGQITGL